MELIPLIFMLVISSASTYIFYRSIRYGADKNPRIFTLFSKAVPFLIFAANISDNLHIIDTGSYGGAYFILGIIPLAAWGISAIDKGRKNSCAAFAVKLMLVVSILEVTVFNLPAYRLSFRDFDKMILSAKLFEGSENTEMRITKGDLLIKGGKEAVIVIENPDIEVGNIRIDLNFSDKARSAVVFADAMDETQTTVYRSSVAEGRIVKDREQSHFIECQLSGKVGNLRLRIIPDGDVYLKNIVLNTPSPLKVLWLRFWIITVVGTLLYAVMNSSLLSRSVSENKKTVKASVAVISAVTVIIAVWVTVYKLGDVSPSEFFRNTEGNQMSQELVEAFENGSSSLLIEPADDLLEFEAPFDRLYREHEGIDIKWDHVFYNGKYYSYYGIAPVILLFMPYHLITGYFLPDAAAVLIFAIIGIIGLAMAFTVFVRKFFPSLPCGLYIICLLIIEAVSGIWFSIGRPLFYETAMAAGFAFLTWAVYFLLSANIIGNGKISLPRTTAASALFAVAVLSRPTLVLYCICAALFMAAALPKMKTKSSDRLFSRSGTTYLCCSFLPMATLGIVQMVYNFTRFGSPFEFGIQYSLTINDFTKAQFHPQLSLIAIYNYLFSPPRIVPVYPIVSVEFSSLGVGGFFYRDLTSTHNVSGLFFLALPMFAYFFGGNALKTIPDKGARIRSAIFTAVPCVIVPLIIIASVWESGYAVRYMVDFAWQSLLGAFAIIFLIYTKSESCTLKKIISGVLCFSLVWTLFSGGVQTINQMFRYDTLCHDYPEIAYDVEQFFAFWK